MIFRNDLFSLQWHTHAYKIYDVMHVTSPGLENCNFFYWWFKIFFTHEDFIWSSNCIVIFSKSWNDKRAKIESKHWAFWISLTNSPRSAMLKLNVFPAYGKIKTTLLKFSSRLKYSGKKRHFLVHVILGNSLPFWENT